MALEDHIRLATKAELKEMENTKDKILIPGNYSNTNTEESVTWDTEIKELEDFFKSVKLPEKPIRIRSGTISNVELFIKGHLKIVKNNNGNPTFLPYLERLQGLKRNLED